MRDSSYLMRGILGPKASPMIFLRRSFCWSFSADKQLRIFFLQLMRAFPSTSTRVLSYTHKLVLLAPQAEQEARRADCVARSRWLRHRTGRRPDMAAYRRDLPRSGIPPVLTYLRASPVNGRRPLTDERGDGHSFVVILGEAQYYGEAPLSDNLRRRLSLTESPEGRFC